MPTGQHEIAVQTSTTAHFAFIRIDLQPSGEDTVTFACPADSVRGWSQAIAQGALAGVSLLRDKTHIGPTHVVIEQFTGLVVDTDTHDAYAAALMATVKAGLAEADWPSLRKVEQPHRWELRWP